MSEAIKCDRCGKVGKKTGIVSEWSRVGDYDFCHDCDLDFYQFLDGKAIPAIDKESA